MIYQLTADPTKIPQPTRDDMMRMLFESLATLEIDIPACYKSLWLTSALDGSKEYFVSEKLMSLVGEDLKKFRAELMKSKSLNQLKYLLNYSTSFVTKNKVTNFLIVLQFFFENLMMLMKSFLTKEFLKENKLPLKALPNLAGGSNIGNTAQQPNQFQPKIKLAPLCQNKQLRKDAKFLDELGILLHAGETSTRLTPFATIIKKQYNIDDTISRNGSKRRNIQKTCKVLAFFFNLKKRLGCSSEFNNIILVFNVLNKFFSFFEIPTLPFTKTGVPFIRY